MSDLFLGEILVLVLLVPVLLRPFFRSLQRLAGIPVLPLLAFLSCFAIIAGSGFRLSFLPVFAFVFIVFVTGLPQLARMIRGLPTDWYSPVAIVWDCVLILAIAVTLKVSWQVRPELSWLPTSPVATTRISEKYSAGVTGDYVIREPAGAAASGSTASRKIVVLTGTGFSAVGSRATLANILACSGWTVVEANYRAMQDYRNVLLSVPSFKAAFVLGGIAFTGKPFFTDESETVSAAGRNLERLVGFAHEKYGVNVPVYAVLEGAGAKAFPAYIASNARGLAGSTVLLSDSDSSSYSVAASVPVLRCGVSGMMPAGAGSYPVLALAGDDSALFGYGEICADDVLAARVLRGVRDEGRKQAEITGRKIATWLDQRRSFNDGN